MKVIAINGSPRKEGNTYQALKTIGAELEKEGIEVSIIQVGEKAIRGCLACGTCGKLKNERCVINDEVNDWIQIMKAADGIILGSPVHFSGIAGPFRVHRRHHEMLPGPGLLCKLIQRESVPPQGRGCPGSGPEIRRRGGL
jgi:hypothetical protein